MGVDSEAPRLIDRGLDLLRPDELTEEELEAFREDYRRKKGQPLPAFEFWIENRPDVLKRYRLEGRRTPDEEALGIGLAGTLSYLQYYAIVGYSDGILYEILNARSRNATRAQLVATLAVAFLHAGPFGMRYVAESSGDYLRDYDDPDPPGTFPDGWSIDPEALRSGLDFSEPTLTPSELALLEDWYLRVCGEVPAYVRHLGRHRPRLLKAYRQRYERSLQGALPNQVLPYLQIHWNVIRGSAPGIREGAQLARGLGMKRAEAIDAVMRALIYGGPAAASIADASIADILESWD